MADPTDPRAALMAAMVGRGLPTDDQNLMAYAQGLPNAPPQQDPDGAYGTLGPATPSWSQWVGDKAQDAMSALGASKTYAQQFGGNARDILLNAPGSGQVISGLDAAHYTGQGQYGQAALSALGAIPMVGGTAAEDAGRAIGNGFARDAARFPESRISTTVPWSAASGAGADNIAHQSNALRIGIDTNQASPAAMAKNAELIKSYPGINVSPDATPEEAHEALIQHATSNILAIHDAVAPDIRPGSQQWYNGANNIAHTWGDEFGMAPENIAGTLAALSPKKDWDMNVSAARRVLDTLHHEGNSVATPEMTQWLTDNAAAMPEGKPKDTYTGHIPTVTSAPLNSLTPYQQAMWVRAYGEAGMPVHTPTMGADGTALPNAFHVINPDGSQGPVKLNAGKGGEPGAPTKFGWNSTDQLANAITAARATDMPTISGAMGGAHKVRNFYNNIIAPDSQQGDVTVDTHAVAAALLRPLGIASDEVNHGLGTSGSSSAATGSKGLYGAYAEAYRRAADQRGILPRQMQSITWEGLRGLYTPAQKNAEAQAAKNGGTSAIGDLWNANKTGQMTQAQVQQQLLTKPDGSSAIRPPRWYTGEAFGEGGEE